MGGHVYSAGAIMHFGQDFLQDFRQDFRQDFLQDFLEDFWPKSIGFYLEEFFELVVQTSGECLLDVYSLLQHGYMPHLYVEKIVLASSLQGTHFEIGKKWSKN